LIITFKQRGRRKNVHPDTEQKILEIACGSAIGVNVVGAVALVVFTVVGSIYGLGAKAVTGNAPVGPAGNSNEHMRRCDLGDGGGYRDCPVRPLEGQLTAPDSRVDQAIAKVRREYFAQPAPE
jgi:hypothetical protein